MAQGSALFVLCRSEQSGKQTLLPTVILSEAKNLTNGEHSRSNQAKFFVIAFLRMTGEIKTSFIVIILCLRNRKRIVCSKNVEFVF